VLFIVTKGLAGVMALTPVSSYPEIYLNWFEKLELRLYPKLKEG
jgi:hypothetical protein